MHITQAGSSMYQFLHIPRVPCGENVRNNAEKLLEFMKQVIPRLMEFQPEFMFVSAGFDAHDQDFINGGMVKLNEFDYEWAT
jgi:acetoin utilization deacetylase AcuC-like enzyme